MSPLLVRTVARHQMRHPWQAGLALAGIALGVAVAVSVALATGAARRAFELSNAELTGVATHHVVAGTLGIPDDFYRHLRVDLGLRGVAPVVDGLVSLTDDPSRTVRIVGVDPFAEADLRGRFGLGANIELDVRRLVTAKDAVVSLNGELLPGASVVVGVGQQARELSVVGAGAAGSAPALAGVLLADVATAQELLGQVGRLTRIDLVADDDTVDRVGSVLPGGSRLITAQAREDTTLEMTRAFELNLRAMSLLAMLCGLFLIYNTVTFAVVQRREQFGTLRALGVTRGQVFGVVLLEAAALGLVGSILGLAAGTALATNLVRLVAQTINDLFYSVAVQQVPVTMPTLAAGAALGVGGTLLAALVPARDATRVPPRVAMIRSVIEEQMAGSSSSSALLGTFLLGVGNTLAIAGTGLPVAFVGLFVAVLGAALLAPLAVRLVSRVAAIVAGAVAGSPGRMAARALSAGLSRNAVAVAALAISVAVVIGVGVMVTSFRTTLTDWLGYTLQADLYMSPAGVASDGAVLSVERDRVEAVVGVARTRAIRSVTLETEPSPTLLFAFDHADEDRNAYRLLDLDARGVAQAWTDFESGAVLVSEPYAERYGVLPGDVLQLPTPGGSREFDVAGAYLSYASDRGAVMINRTHYREIWGDAAINGLSVYLEPGAAAAADEVRALFATGAVQVVSNAGLRQRSLEVFDRTFRITGVLRTLVTLVAVVGVFGAMLALQLERSREHGMLRAIGFTPSQLARSLLMQSTLAGAAAAILALPLGWMLAWLMIHVINKRSFGWTLTMVVPPSELFAAVAVALGAAFLAAIYPAFRIARASPAAVMRAD